MSNPDAIKHTTLDQLQALVAHVAEQCPELASRVERASHILLAGKVASIGADRYQVTNSEGDGTYTVDQLAETCECKDREHRAPEWKGAKWCKHLLAVLLLRHLGASRPSARLDRVRRFRPAVTRRPLRKAA